jgi:hypothetical protein
LTGVIGSDQVSISGSATGAFATKDAGTGKTVNASLSAMALSGSDAGNYQVIGVTSPLSANINQATLTISGLTAQNKVYDSTTSATLSGTAALTGVVGSDQVSISGTPTGSFGTPDVGTNKPVTIVLGNLALGGSDSGNYVLSGATSPLQANINAATVAGPQTNPVSTQTTPPPATNPTISTGPVANVPETSEPGGLSYVYVSGGASDAASATPSSGASVASSTPVAVSASSDSSAPASSASASAPSDSAKAADSTSSPDPAPSSGGSKKGDSGATNEPAQNSSGKTDVYVIDGGINLSDQEAGASQ